MDHKKSRSSKGNGVNCADFTGHWYSTFGLLKLEHRDDEVIGTYHLWQFECEIQGHVTGNRLNFRYREPNVCGEGWFDLIRTCRFIGQWRPDGSNRWFNWVGERGFDGIWNSSFGLLKLVVQDNGSVNGFYQVGGQSVIEGNVNDSEIQFNYTEPKACGEGMFSLDEDATYFSGTWREEGREQVMPWEGERIQPTPGLVRLVVLESYWQQHLDEREFSFGAMLEEFFARLPYVVVNRRFFSDADSLLHWCQQLMYMPEPIYLVIATHAKEEGLCVLGNILDHGILAQGLNYADTVQLVHFSSCLMMDPQIHDGPATRLKALGRFPISGYSTSVNWANSAIIEFMYLNLMLEYRLIPSEAAKELLRLMPFAGNTPAPESICDAAGFQIWEL